MGYDLWVDFQRMQDDDRHSASRRTARPNRFVVRSARHAQDTRDTKRHEIAVT